ncbi:hypothetical protein J6590_094392 [Homalodisca vitripennis]|nr:hypothetical protein J6590_094392 [Homalodisca vitripennis]
MKSFIALRAAVFITSGPRGVYPRTALSARIEQEHTVPVTLTQASLWGLCSLLAAFFALLLATTLIQHIGHWFYNGFIYPVMSLALLINSRNSLTQMVTCVLYVSIKTRKRKPTSLAVDVIVEFTLSPTICLNTMPDQFDREAINAGKRSVQRLSDRRPVGGRSVTDRLEPVIGGEGRFRNGRISVESDDRSSRPSTAKNA